VLVRYVAGLKAQDGGFLVHFPQFPEIVTDGADIVEAIANAREALELVLEDMAEDGEMLPDPSETDTWSALLKSGVHPQFIDAIAPDGQAAQRYNISMTPALMERVDRKADERKMSRSSFIAQALKEALRG
jgi:predicted RNase H-like HicB family nuclease